VANFDEPEQKKTCALARKNVQRIMPKTRKIATVIAAAGAALLIGIYFARPDLTEAERVELETRRDIERQRLIVQNKIRTSPHLMLELLFVRTNDPLQFYVGRAEIGLKRLQELGVLQDRTFQIIDTNGNPAKFSVYAMFQSNDVLWQVTGPRTNGVVEVRAFPSSMKAWEKLERDYAEKRAKSNRAND
jgi:hypothetical protein